MTVKELKTNNMGYTPYKMLGHELKGIKQRAPLEMSMEKTHINENMVDGVSKKPGSGINYGAAVGGSPAKGFFSNIMDKIRPKKSSSQTTVGTQPPEEDMVSGVGTPVEGGGDGGAVPPHGDEAHSGGAVGGEPEGFQAMGFKDFKGMNTKDRGQYMKGLNKDDLKTQMQSNHKGMMGGGGGGGWGGFSSAIGGMFSDVRLKEKIEKTGKSPSGIPTYEFNYIGDNNRYSGVMAQDLIEMNIDAVSMDDSGFYTVNYNNIDVDMHLIN